jgi:hypothetical protein
MGAGVYPAGYGPAGLDVVLPPGASPPVGLTPIQYYPRALGVSTPLVLAYNPQVLGFVQNADGTLQGVHPIDQQVALALFIEYGSIKSAPTVGSKLRALLNRVDPNRAQAIAGGEIARCLGTLIAQNAILLLNLRLEQSNPGRWLVAVAYTNLKDPRYNPGNPALSSAQSQARVLLGNVGSSSA